MEDNLVVCIPGIWESRKDFLEAVITSTNGEYIFAGGLLAHPKGNDHVILYYEEIEDIEEAFKYAGQGKISDESLAKLSNSKGATFLLFPLDIIGQKKRLLKFTKVISNCGGIAVKLETSGIAHEWEKWFDLIESDNPFDQYCASVLLIADKDEYFSCGMHNFGLPDSQISNRFGAVEAADLINRFNYYQIVEKPNLKSGHTFSLTIDSPYFRLELIEDNRHLPDSLFYNSNGVWNLTEA